MEMCWVLSEIGILDSNGTILAHQPFEGRLINASASNSDTTAVLVDRQEVWQLVDEQWSCLLTSDQKLHCLAWTEDERLLVGTENARLAECVNNSLVFITSFDEIPERAEWLTPWGGPPDTRSIAVSIDGTIYVNIHVGWITRSIDNGKTWTTLKGMDMDVHQVACSPDDPAVVLVATTDGFFFSNDHGDLFIRQSNDMPYYYQRACVIFPDTGICLTSTSQGPHDDCGAQLYWSHDDGRTWTLCQGLPDNIDKNINTHQILVTGTATALAVINDRELYESSDSGKSWVHASTLPARVLALAIP